MGSNPGYLLKSFLLYYIVNKSDMPFVTQTQIANICPIYGFHPQQLTNDFRYNYAQFWHSILKADLEGIKQSADCLGVGKLYGLFACMVTGRSWGSIQKGIDKAEKNSAEVGIFEKINKQSCTS